MAVGLPAEKLEIAPTRAYARGYPILSGEDGASELLIGVRGITQQINYLYSRGRTLFTMAQWATPGSLDFGAWWFETESASYVAATGYVPIWVSADVATVTLSADIDNLDLQLEIEGGATSSITGGSSRGTLSGTIAVTPGAVSIRVNAKTNTSGVGKLYSLSVRETTLVSGDFP